MWNSMSSTIIFLHHLQLIFIKVKHSQISQPSKQLQPQFSKSVVKIDPRNVQSVQIGPKAYRRREIRPSKTTLHAFGRSPVWITPKPDYSPHKTLAGVPRWRFLKFIHQRIRERSEFPLKFGSSRKSREFKKTGTEFLKRKGVNRNWSLKREHINRNAVNNLN